MRNDDHRRRLYEQCVDQHAASLFRVAFRLTSSRDTAEELVQETYLCAWRDISKLNDVSKLRSWMFSILRNQYGKSTRRRGLQQTLTDPMIENLADRRAASRDEIQGQLQNAINGLGDDFRMPLLLVSMEGLSVDEAAAVLEVPRGTVLSRLHRARRRLKAVLERQMHGESGHATPIKSRPQSESDEAAIERDRKN
jgi:RNA polymerase sigma-70 factor (ECF subfamily)